VPCNHPDRAEPVLRRAPTIKKRLREANVHPEEASRCRLGSKSENQVEIRTGLARDKGGRRSGGRVGGRLTQAGTARHRGPDSEREKWS
jgi:hypothetical protein